MTKTTKKKLDIEETENDEIGNLTTYRKPQQNLHKLKNLNEQKKIEVPLKFPH